MMGKAQCARPRPWGAVLARGAVAWLALAASAAPGCTGGDEHGPEEEGDLSAAWNEAYEQQQGGKADSPACSGVLVPDQQKFLGRVALTFDDGPNPATTPRVLDILAERGIRATFFINGRRVSSAVEWAILERMLAEGHMLANHSHQHKDLKGVTAEELARQVSLTRAILDEAGESRRYFRFPYGSAGCTAAAYVRDQGETITGWHVDSADWCFASSQGGVGHCDPETFAWVPDGYRHDMVGYTMSQVKKHDGGLVLFHDVHPNTVEQLPAVIDALVGAGYTFTNVDDEAAFPLLHGKELPFVGDACELDDACGFDAAAYCLRYAYGDDMNAGMCSLACEGTCPDRFGKAPTFCAAYGGAGAGACLPKAGPLNEQCASLPGTQPTELQRHLGSSSAPAATAVVCAPVSVSP